jgi:hypothetical protein
VDFYRRKAARSERTRVHPVWQETHGIHRQYELRQPRGYLAGVDRILQLFGYPRRRKAAKCSKREYLFNFVHNFMDEISAASKYSNSNGLALFSLENPLNRTEPLIYGEPKLIIMYLYQSSGGTEPSEISFRSERKFRVSLGQFSDPDPH